MPKYIPFFLFLFLLFFLPFFCTIWLIDLSPPPFIILHHYLFLSFFLFTNILNFSHPHVSSTFPLSLFWWTLFSLSSSQISSILTKLFLCLLLSLTHENNHDFIFGSKTLAEHCIVTVLWMLLSSSSFLFFFFCQKKFRRSTHCWKEIFAWNYPEHWCEFNIWQNVMVEPSTMVIWCCESVMFLFIF